jgi:hypothetical protein
MSNRYEQSRAKSIRTIQAKGFEILSEYDGRQCTVTKIKVRNITCGHIFEAASGNLIHRNVKCPICNIVQKREQCRINNEAHKAKFRETATEWDAYKQTVYTLTRHEYTKHKKTVNPLGLKRGLAGVEGAYHIDHIVAVRWCFDNRVPPEVCAHHTNLQMLSWMENIVARDHIKPGTIPTILESYVMPALLEHGQSE